MPLSCYENCATQFPVATFPFLQCVKDCIAGGNNVPTCNPTHHSTTLVQGPGKCCAAWSAAGFTNAQVGQRVAITLSNGKCGICEVKILKKGGFGFKRGKAQVPGSQVSCPTTRQGCCNLV